MPISPSPTRTCRSNRNEGERFVEQASTEAVRASDDGFKPVKELRESLLLIVLMLSSMSAFIGLGAVAVRLFAGTR
jgi:hypothetical protein